jgi:FkbM family methyltransferase
MKTRGKNKITNHIILRIEKLFGNIILLELETFKKIFVKIISLITSWDWNTANELLLTLFIKKFSRIPLRIVINNFRFNIRWPSSDIGILNEVLKGKYYFAFSDLEPKEGNLIIDLGAYIGAYTVYAAKKGAQVIAVEPASSNLELLLQNVLLNNVSEKVNILKAAVGSSKGFVKFPSDSIDPDLAAFSLYNFKNTWTKYEKVPLLRLNDILTLYNIKKIDIIKLDIEGAELEVLKSTYSILKTYKPKLVVEVHREEDLKFLIQYLVNINYIVRIKRMGNIIYLYALPLIK